jgi:hypothetical protein
VGSAGSLTHPTVQEKGTLLCGLTAPPTLVIKMIKDFSCIIFRNPRGYVIVGDELEAP